jgi:hypothetical protein
MALFRIIDPLRHSLLTSTNASTKAFGPPARLATAAGTLLARPKVLLFQTENSRAGSASFTRLHRRPAGTRRQK